MIHKKFYLATLFFILFAFTSCEKEVIIAPYSCILSTINKAFSEPQIDVTYKLEADGSYTIASWFYWDESGKVEVLNPVVPSEITVTLNNQKKMLAGAVGEVVEGSIKVSFKAVTIDTVYIGIDQCAQQLN